MEGPFEPPAENTAAVSSAYRSLEGWMRINVFLQINLVVTSVLLIVVECLALSGVPEGGGGVGAALNTVYGLLSLWLLGTSVPALVVLAVWQYRAASNLRLTDRPLVYTPGSHVLAWFVPVVNLVLPYWTMGELVRKSHEGPGQAGTGDLGEEARLPMWWMFYVGSMVIDVLATLDFVTQDAATGMLSQLALESLSAVLLAVGTWHYVAIVRGVTADQEGRWGRGDGVV